MTLARTVLVCTLGSSWSVVPEIYGWLAPMRLNLYRHSPDASALEARRAQAKLAAPDEIWVVCSETSAIATQSLCRWWSQLRDRVELRIWRACGTGDLSSAVQCARMRELVLRVVLHAGERTGAGGQLVLSLAGGRKTMSADLQDAGGIFGAHAWVHVVAVDPLPDALLTAGEDMFLAPLRADLAGAVTPILIGGASRAEWLDIELDGRPPVSGDGFALEIPEAGEILDWTGSPRMSMLSDELHQRRLAAQRLLGNYVSGIVAHDPRENWRSLFRLAPADIGRLRMHQISETDRPWLVRMPKADLHRHLGGCLDVGDQQQVARAVWSELNPRERARATDEIRPIIDTPVWPSDWAKRIKSAASGRLAASVAMLCQMDRSALEQALWPEQVVRVGLKSRLGFSAYEQPGELSGSALLAHPAALEPYAQAVVRQARDEGIGYLELRGSPHKYWPLDARGFVLALRNALANAGAQVHRFDALDPAPRIGFLWILDRRDPARIASVVREAVAAREVCADFLLGLDLAGDEATYAPQDLAGHFEPAFEACMPLTIHAGEGEPADRIWQAVYHLHAERVGHGLSLADSPALAARLRDRGVALEICPTSNREVVGYRDPALAQTSGYPAYPLAWFLESGQPVTICTDNPGISRTTLADEWLAAARMGVNGITAWQAFAVARQGFEHAFVEASERAAMIGAFEARAYSVALEAGRVIA